MKILVFLHGTTVMHKNATSRPREERVKQSVEREESVLDYATYVPVGDAVQKLRNWSRDDAKIIYLSSHTESEDVAKDRFVLEKYDFPKGEVFFRQVGESYADVAEKIMPDVLIEDDCESIGGEKAMTYPYIRLELQSKIKSVVVEEFEGIDQLPDNPQDLLKS